MKRYRRREVMAGLGTAGLGLLSVNPLFGAPAPQDIAELAFVAPDLREAAERIQAFAAGRLPAVHRIGGETLRQKAALIPWVKRTINGLEGNPNVTLFVINAKAHRKRGGILFMHGGGFMSGSAEGDVSISRELAAILDCTIVSVEYRLAPATGYAGSIEDNYAALLWTYRNAPDIGIDPQRIALVGESAGGCHAALLAITARDRKEVPVAFQCLAYPMLDDRTGVTQPIPPHVGTLAWTAQANRYGWRSFLGREPGLASMTSGVPAREANLVGLPPAWIGVGSIDLFAQEAGSYARRLAAAGVQTEFLLIPGAFHGFDVIAPDTPSSQRFTASKIRALQRAINT